MACFTVAITPGRSGSTFAAAVLRDSFPGYDITHERLGPASTLPRRLFHAYDGARKQTLAAHQPVIELMDRVEAELDRGRPVVTMGQFTSHLVPVLVDRFPGRLRVIGLFRHPLMTAASFFVRGRYHGWPAWSIGDLGSLTPFDPGMRAAGFAPRWAGMSAFEKCLYYWVEYVMLWREIQSRYPGLPALLVPSEDLFRDAGARFAELARFVGFDGPIRLGNAPRNEFNPKGSRRYPLGNLWRGYRRHPEVLELSDYLGYRLDDAELEAKMRRYQPPDSALYRILFAARWYHVKGFVGHRLRPRFWRDHRRAREGELLLADRGGDQ